MQKLIAASMVLSAAVSTSTAFASNVFEAEHEHEYRQRNCGDQTACTPKELSLKLFGDNNGTLISKADSDTSNNNYTLNFSYQLDATGITSAFLKVWLRDDSTSADDSATNGTLKDKHEYAGITSINGSSLSPNWKEVDGYKQYINLDVRNFLSSTGLSTLTAVLDVKDSGSKDYYFKAAELYVQYCLNNGSGGNDSVASVPVPAAAWLMASGLLGLLGFNKRKTGAA
ncbi:VPLPA-CTERM sorting domain-containing protein [Methylomonas sp. HW2-6]|uniref:VPLPA-CTERM sorting domain-containing protein n=1 Tax=Methylomonas sp. HW2-6 TaxID=3376687 RepID=UPI004042F77C